MINRINYLKYGPKPKRLNSQKDINLIVENIASNLEALQVTEEEESEGAEEELKIYFESIVVGDDLDAVKTKMLDTIDFRVKTIKNRSTKFGQIFPMYFTHPELVNITSNTIMHQFNFSHKFTRFCSISKFDCLLTMNCHWLKNGQQ